MALRWATAGALEAMAGFQRELDIQRLRHTDKRGHSTSLTALTGRASDLALPAAVRYTILPSYRRR